MTSANVDTNEPKPGLLRRLMRGALRTGVTLSVAAVALFAVQLGSAELMRRADAATPPAAAAPLPVTTVPLQLEPGYQVTRNFIGQIEPQRTVAVSFELSGRLNDITIDEGDRVVKGQVLASLDTRLLEADRSRLEASRTAMEAQLQFARQTLERQSELTDRGFATQAGVDQAVSRADELIARIAEIEAALMSNDIQIEKSTLTAPFDGTVTARRVDGGESLSPGQTLIEIVQDATPQMRIGVPLDIEAADLTEAAAQIGGRTVPARLIRLRPDVDPVTRTRTAIFELDDTSGLTFGQTASLILTDDVAEPGFWVATTTLKEGTRGQWTVLGVDNDNRVRALSVQVLHTDEDEVYVTGAVPDGTQLITNGPQRVTVGQTVAPLIAAAR